MSRTIFEVAFDATQDAYDRGATGAGGDGVFVARFKSESKARAFASAHTLYGRAEACEARAVRDVPARLLARWTFQG